ncbi:uncharacterized protein LOC116941255 isoform X3 [Petromyzon marinus]|uniref:uncharacterized protein LOC116941255 isoform X3 n=1 Tax=Petromyzon marinus TaxID=7757 RepID=UPI003F721D75
MGDELLHVEEKAKRKAEKRRAKKKRQKERKRIEQAESGLAGTLLTLGIQDSSSDDDEGEEGEDAEEDEEEEEEEVERNLEALNGLNRNCDTNFGGQTNGDDFSRRRHSADRKSKTKKSRGKSTAELGEQDAEWDVNSAFFAVAASHVKALQKPSKADKKRRSEASMMEAKDPDSDSLKSREYLLLGNDRAQNGQYSEAVKCFSKAISIDPYDYRPFGNRSYCYDMLRQFPKALKDADVALDLFPGWAKGHFRRGRALLGLEKYKQAEEAFKRVLDLDKDCEEAVEALFSIKVERLMDHGFTREDSEKALNQEESFEAAHNFLVNSTDYLETMDISNGSDSDIFHNNHMGQTSRMEANSLWIGNVTSNVTEKAIMDLFKRAVRWPTLSFSSNTRTTTPATHRRQRARRLTFHCRETRSVDQSMAMSVISGERPDAPLKTVAGFATSLRTDPLTSNRGSASNRSRLFLSRPRSNSNVK